MTRFPALLLLLSACSAAPENETDANVASRAAALEAQTDAQVKQSIKAMEAESQALTDAATLSGSAAASGNSGSSAQE